MAEERGSGAVQLGRGSPIGRYLVLDLLGKGGMGEVYAAYDPELDRKVAIKVLRASSRAGTDQAEAQARILREAQALAQLSDPNVVAVYDVGTFDERVFLAMEFVDGSTLSFWRQARVRTWRDLVAVYAAAGRGLAAAHKRGLIHRDFKPENVMVGLDGQVRVMDFGLARSERQPALAERTGRSPSPLPTKSIDPLEASRATPMPASAAEAGSPPQDANWDLVTRDFAQPVASAMPPGPSPNVLMSPLTQVGAMMGTPAYMAPEQFAGKVADAKSDQFSFCVALYEALYDERPFIGKDLTDLGLQVAAGRVRPAPPYARVPGWLRKVLLRGLRAEREERHPSMEALLDSLARDPRRRWSRYAAGASVAVLIASLSVGLIHASRVQRTQCLGADAKLAGVWEPPGLVGAPLSPRKEAIRLAFMKTGKRYAAEAFTLVQSMLDRYVTSWSTMHRDACEATHVRGEQSEEGLDLRMLCLQDRFNEVRALTSVLNDASGAVVSKSAAAVQALRSLQECADIATLKAVVRPPDDPAVRGAVAEVRVALAEVKAQRDAGRLKDAATGIGPVIARAQQTGYEPLIAEALLESGEVASLQGDLGASEKLWEQAMWSAESARYDEVALFAAAELVYTVGYRQSRFADGERWSHLAGAILKRLGKGHDQAAGWLANNQGLLYEREGKLDLALTSALEAVEIKTRAFGHDHFDVALSEDNVAEILLALGRGDEALTRNDSALKTLRATLGPDHPFVAFALQDNADLMNAKGRYQEAKAAAEGAIQICNRELDPQHPLVAFALVHLGKSLLGLKRPAEAVKVLEQAMALAEHNADDPSLRGEAKYALARALTATGRSLSRARTLAHEAASLFRKTPGQAKMALEIEAWAQRGGDPRQASLR